MVRLRTQLVVYTLLVVASARLYADKISDIRPQGYVTDLAGVLDPATKTKVEALCTEVEQKTGAQIAVVTVKSLDGQSREDYAADLYKHLGVGSKKSDRGVLLLLAPSERQYKVEVGYGLEPVINDARAGDIGRSMVPSLRSGDYNGAVLMAVTQLAQLIAADKGVQLTGLPKLRTPQPAKSSGLPWWLILVFFIGIPWLFSALGRRRGGPPGLGGGRRGYVPPVVFLPPMGGGWGHGGGFGGSSGGFGGGGGFGGFGGGMSGGGGAGGSW
jgi:uncharacterized protein